MSVQAIGWALEHSRAELGARLVLLSLANHANDEAQAWISNATIQRETRLSERSVRYALRELEGIGEIHKAGKHPKHRTTIYALSWGQNLPGMGANLAAQRGQEVPPNQLPNRQGTATEGSGRSPDEVWNALEAIYGPPVAKPHPDHGRRNKAVKMLRDAGAEPAEIQRIRAWAVRHRDESIRSRVQTAVALATNIGDLRRLSAEQRSSETVDPAMQYGTPEWHARVEREEQQAIEATGGEA